MRLGSVFGHVRIPAKAALAHFFGGLQHGGRIGVLEQHVGAAIDERGGGLGFLGRVEPVVDPHHAGLDGRVGALRTQREAVDVANHLGNRHRSHHAQGIGLGHLPGQHTRHVGTLVGAAVVGRQVGRGLVAGGVLKLGIRKIFGDLEHGLHEAETGSHHQMVALGGQVTHHTLGVWTLGHFFNDAGLHLVTEFGFHRLAAIVMRKGPAAIAHWPHVHEGHFQRALGRSRRRCARCRRLGRAG